MSRAETDALRDALWVSRCVGRAESAPLQKEDVGALARYLQPRTLEAGEPLHKVGEEPAAVTIVRDGAVELAVPARTGRVVIATLRPGDVDGDIQLLLGLPMPYEARASQPTTCLLLPAERFHALLSERPALSKRWLTSVSGRLVRSHSRLTTLLGKSLESQIAQLMLDEQHDGIVDLSQGTLAAMLGVRRPSVNRIIQRFVGAGLVEVGYGSIKLLDASQLARVAAR